jgi:hypothetical protein
MVNVSKIITKLISAVISCGLLKYMRTSGTGREWPKVGYRSALIGVADAMTISLLVGVFEISIRINK